MDAFIVSHTARVSSFIQPPGTTGQSNCGVVRAGEELVLIDSMLTPGMVRGLVGLLGQTADCIGHVIHTHGHIDHIGGNAALPRAEFWGTEETSAAIARLE